MDIETVHVSDFYDMPVLGIVARDDVEYLFIYYDRCEYVFMLLKDREELRRKDMYTLLREYPTYKATWHDFEAGKEQEYAYTYGVPVRGEFYDTTGLEYV